LDIVDFSGASVRKAGVKEEGRTPRSPAVCDCAALFTGGFAVDRVSVLAIVVLALGVWVGFCALVAQVAASYHRPPGLWFLHAVVLGPPLALILLMLAGDPVAREELAEREERIRSRHPDLKDARYAALNEARCPECGAAVNPVTGDGLHSPEAEPWLLLCNGCERPFEPD
jgi:hypothetical protein